MRYLTYILLLLILLGCADRKPKIKIGFSHSYYWGAWGKLMYNEMMDEISLYNDYSIELIMKDALNSSIKQKKDIAELRNENVDILIVFPVDSLAIVPIISELYDKGTPVLVLDRELASNKYTTFITNDNFLIGKEAGLYSLKKLKNKGTILELTGASGSSTTTERSAGFNEVIKNQADIKIISQINGEWLPYVTKKKVDSVFKTGIIPDLIFAHSDAMAYAASQACSHLKKKPVILGVDGLTTPDGGLNMVLNHSIDATFLNYPGGDKAIQCAIDIFQHKKVKKKIKLKTTVIDEHNAQSFMIANEIRTEQLDKIAKLKVQINKMFGTIKLQNVLIILSIAFISLFILLIIIILHNYRQKHNYISLISQQKDQIEEQMMEEKALTETLTFNNNLLKEQQDEILLKNQNLEIYRNNLEKLVNEKTEDLRLALQRAEESDKLKTSFLSNLSHEIRTPLNAILGFSEIITDSSRPDAEKIKYHSFILQNSSELLTIIDNIVEISKLTSQKVQFEKDDIDLSQLCKEIQDEIINKLLLSYHNQNPKDIRFIIDTPANLHIRTDRARIKQILSHLISNAYKFTNQGYITVGCNTGKGMDEIIFYVKDTGIGIKKKNQKLIFDKFSKIEDNDEQLFRGTGLGLAIVKNLTELLGGTVSVESEFGKGSVFSIRLPLSVVSKTLTHNASEYNKPQLPIAVLNNKKILVAEDEDSNYTYIEALLMNHHMIIDRVTNGAEAVRYFAENTKPDLVLMDIKMPVMNGIDALKKIKSLHPELPIIALTAYGFITEKQKLIKEGFDDYLPKPFIRKDFLDKIVFHLGRKTS